MTYNLSAWNSQNVILVFSGDSFPVINVLLGQKLIVSSFCVLVACLGLALETLTLLNDIISKLVVDRLLLIPLFNFEGLDPNGLRGWNIKRILQGTKFSM